MGWALFAAGLYLGMGAAIAWNTVRPKRSRPTITPTSFHVKTEDVRFESKDGARIAGWLIKPEETARGVVILCHGVDSTREAMLTAAELLHRHAFACLL